MVTLPLWLGPGSLLEVSNLLVLAIVGCSIVVLTGWAGQVSLGQMSFAAVGAVAGAVAMIDWNWDLSLALLAGGSGRRVSPPFWSGSPPCSLDGIFVAVTTLAFGLAVSGYLLDRAEFSWIPSGQLPTPRLFGVADRLPDRGASPPASGWRRWWSLAMHGLRHSRFGRVLRALSTNERAVAGYGVGREPGQAERLRRLRVHRRVGGMPAGGGQPAVRRVTVHRHRQPGRVHRHRRGRPGLGGGRGRRRRPGGGERGLPASQLAAVPLRLRRPLVLLAFPGGVSSLLFARPRPPRCGDRPPARDRRGHRCRACDRTATGWGHERPGAWPRAGRRCALFPLAMLFGLQLLDQATQSAFNVLIPNVRDAFHLSNAEILLIVALAGAAALVGTIPVAWLADRTVRVRIALIGAGVGAAFSVALGFAPTAVVLAITLCGVYLGQAVIFPTHNSLIADYYPVEARPGSTRATGPGSPSGR